MANRGYIFEAVWAAAVAARFYKRFGQTRRLQQMQSAYQSKSIGLQKIGRLPPVNASDVQNMIIRLFGGEARSFTMRTQPDVVFDQQIEDYLMVNVGVPKEVNNLMVKVASTRNFSEIRDFIQTSASVANAHARLNERVRAVAFNGITDTISITADGLVDQRTVKADVTVSISTQDPNIKDIPDFAVSCKVTGGEQFAQVSGGEWKQFEDLFQTIGVRIPDNVKKAWFASMQKYLDEDIFKKKYATRQAIKDTTIPDDIRSAAKDVYRAVANLMNSNFPKQGFVDYVVDGFSSGVDTDVVKLVHAVRGGRKVMVEGKTLFVDSTFKDLMMTKNYRATYQESAGGAKIVIKATGIKDPILQFRYKWENKSNKTKNQPDTYSMYPRHYLEADDGIFDIDPRSQKVTSYAAPVFIVSTLPLWEENPMYNKGMKNTHLEHLEDEILNRGSAGAEDVISVLRSADDILTGKSNDLGITTKWDGAPAVVCGTCPQTGKFFVGTKSVFNKTTPKICYTEADIDQWYQGALASKLKTCLQYLPQLRIIGIVQGDLLFTDDVIPGVIGKNKVLTFTPNTITYTVPVGSEAAIQIMQAKMGIVFHTTYIGPSIQTAEVVTGTPDIRGSEDVFVASAKFDGYVKVSDAQIRHYRALLNRAVGSLKQASNFLDVFNSGESRFVMAAMFKQFFNQVIRNGYIIRSTKYVASEFANFYAGKMESEIQSKKSDAAKAKYLRMKTDGLKFIIANERAIYFTVASYLNIRSAKKFVIDQLNSGGTIGTYTRSKKGYQRTTPEGFVLIKSGGAYKFVDDNFRRANVTVVKNWDK